MIMSSPIGIDRETSEDGIEIVSRALYSDSFILVDDDGDIPDLTTTTWAMEIRVDNGQPEGLPGAPGLILRITSAGTAGNPRFIRYVDHVDLVIPSASTETLAKGEYVYDIYVTYSDGERERLVVGPCLITQGVTRS